MANNFEFADGSVCIVNQWDLASVATAFDVNVSRTITNTRTIGGNDVTPSTNYAPTFSASAYALFGADGWEEESFGLMTNTDENACVGIYGGAAGDVAYAVFGYADSLAKVTTVDGVMEANVAHTGHSFMRGLCLNSKTAITGTGAQTGQNIGTIAALTTTCVVIQCTVDNFTSATFQIYGSSDNAVGDPYAQITGWTVTAYGNATAGTDEVTFSGIGYAIFTKTAGTEAWARLQTTAFSGTTGTFTVTAGKRY